MAKVRKKAKKAGKKQPPMESLGQACQRFAGHARGFASWLESVEKEAESLGAAIFKARDDLLVIKTHLSVEKEALERINADKANDESARTVRREMARMGVGKTKLIKHINGAMYALTRVS